MGLGNKLGPLTDTSQADAPEAQLDKMSIHSNAVTPGTSSQVVPVADSKQQQLTLNHHLRAYLFSYDILTFHSMTHRYHSTFFPRSIPPSSIQASLW